MLDRACGNYEGLPVHGESKIKIDNYIVDVRIEHLNKVRIISPLKRKQGLPTYFTSNG